MTVHVTLTHITLTLLNISHSCFYEKKINDSMFKVRKACVCEILVPSAA